MGGPLVGDTLWWTDPLGVRHGLLLVRLRRPQPHPEPCLVAPIGAGATDHPGILPGALRHLGVSHELPLYEFADGFSDYAIACAIAWQRGWSWTMAPTRRDPS